MPIANKMLVSVACLVFASQQLVFAQDVLPLPNAEQALEKSIDPSGIPSEAPVSIPIDPTASFLMSGNLTPSETEPETLLMGSVTSAVPAASSVVRVQAGDRRLFVRDRLSDGTLGAEYAFVAKGVNWSPHTKNADPANLHLEFANWYQTDIPMMAEMGINVVRVYHDFGTGAQAQQILDKFYEYGIRVIVTVDMPRQGVVADTANISAVVNAYKNHPAVLMWAVGNEWDLPNKSTGRYYYGKFATFNEAANYIEQSAQLIKTLDTNHPVTTFYAEPHIPHEYCQPYLCHPLSQEMSPGGVGPYTSDVVNTMIPSVDVWGINVYRGNSFQNVFGQWRSITEKPMFIGEFGADSYDHNSGGENQTLQGNWDKKLWDELYFDLSAERTDGAAIGGLVFEWNDEWWKSGDAKTHNLSYEFNGGQPDSVNDEEWFGIVDIDRNKKSLFNTMQDRYRNGINSVDLYANPVLKASSGTWAKFGIDDKTAYALKGGGGGGRGINFGILDPYTGIRMKETKAFDTYLMQYWGGPHLYMQAMIDYLNSIPTGSIVLMSIADEGGFWDPNGNKPWSDPKVEAAYQAIEAVGSQKIRSVKYNGQWAMIFVKGGAVLAEGVATTSTTLLEIQAQVTLQLDPLHGLLDTAAPVGSFSVNGGAAGTNNRAVTLDLSGITDSGSGVQDISYAFNTLDPAAFSAWETFSPSKQVEIPAYEGVNYVNVRVRDRSGNIGFFWQPIRYDLTPPAGSLTINGGAASTASTTVSLGIDVTDGNSGVAQISYAVNSLADASFSAWENYSASKSIQIPGYQGTNYVNVRVRDNAGNVRLLYASIIYDPVPPSGYFTINDGASYTSSRNVSLNFSVSDNGPLPFQISYALNSLAPSAFSSWETLSGSKSIQLPDYEGRNYVNVKVRDAAGNETLLWSSIVLDRTAPAGTVVINGGATTTSSRTVDLALNVTDGSSGIAQMSFAFNSLADSDFSAWETFSATKQVQLPSYQGQNYVNVRVRDAAGNVQLLWSSIYLQSVSPVVPANWTAAPSNPNFAFTSYYESDPLEPSAGWQIFEAQNLGTGEVFFTRQGDRFQGSTGYAIHDYVTDARDVSPDGAALVYERWKANVHYATIRKVSHPDFFLEFVLEQGLKSIIFNEDNTVTLVAQEIVSPFYCHNVDLTTLSVLRSYVCSAN